MAQVKALFFVPLKDNDGTDLAVETENLKMELRISNDGRIFGIRRMRRIHGNSR